MKIYTVKDPEFLKYGHVIEGYDCAELIAAMAKTPLPDDVIYVPSDKDLEALPVYQQLTEREYGGLPIQIGY